MQLKQFYNIATYVSSRKKCYYFLVIYLTAESHVYVLSIAVDNPVTAMYIYPTKRITSHVPDSVYM